MRSVCPPFLGAPITPHMHRCHHTYHPGTSVSFGLEHGSSGSSQGWLPISQVSAPGTSLQRGLARPCHPSRSSSHPHSLSLCVLPYFIYISYFSCSPIDWLPSWAGYTFPQHRWKTLGDLKEQAQTVLTCPSAAGGCLSLPSAHHTLGSPASPFRWLWELGQEKCTSEWWLPLGYAAITVEEIIIF